jgi:hypothetical protein
MDVLRCAMTLNCSKMGIKATKISVRSLWTGGAMAMLFGWIGLDSIQMMGR